ncbi:MAG: polysaccharide deacetylase family protein [Kiritimatiellae bacterium]|jgi:peptidoglycan/xylan/chitin deacetylase (PgdA/CDA1 family)|nr:polysaccharide deacetylase family protein [Kiritimatiellia bacterium]
MMSKLNFIIMVLSAGILNIAAANQEIGTSSITKWQNDKKACFLLMFDDSWPSHYQVAVPELLERDIVATFYVNPGKGEYKSCIKHWEGTNAVWKQGMAYGNHTMTHQGVKDFEDAELEIGGCDDYILDIIPGKNPRLISWAQPGVGKGKWNISKEELNSILAKNNLINRPTFTDHGAVYHMQKSPQMLALADKAISSGGMEYLIIHGVERRKINWGYQDFWALNQDVYREVLDGLVERRDRGDLWITDHISYYKYDQERDNSQIQIISSNKDKIKLKITSSLDSQLYDQPLTIKTVVPENWQKCTVSQGSRISSNDVKNGVVQYDALPDESEIILTMQN